MEPFEKKRHRSGATELKNNDAIGLSRWETRHVSEVSIKRNQDAALGDADIINSIVRGS
jgi:hypothetical protein